MLQTACHKRAPKYRRGVEVITRQRGAELSARSAATGTESRGSGGFCEIGSDGDGGEQREARLLRDREQRETRLQGRRGEQSCPTALLRTIYIRSDCFFFPIYKSTTTSPYLISHTTRFSTQGQNYTTSATRTLRLAPHDAASVNARSMAVSGPVLPRCVEIALAQTLCMCPVRKRTSGS